jgi:acyl carrier protein
MTTFDKVKEMLVDQLGVDGADVTETTVIVDDLGADSLDVIELIMMFEEEFNIEIPDECGKDIYKMTVRDAANYIDKEMAK